jgi:hypothetical protein
LGSPMVTLMDLWKTQTARTATAVVPGALMLIAVIAAFVMLWRHRAQYSSARAMLVFFSIFLVATCVVIAYGRSEDDHFNAFLSKYLTPVYILWVSMLLAAWPLVRQRKRLRAAICGGLCAAILLAIALHQAPILAAVRQQAQGVNLAEAAAADNVTDPDAWYWLFHPPEVSLDTLDLLRKNHLTLFTEEWTQWPGMALNSRFSIDSAPKACEGAITSSTRVPGMRPGWRINGWGWDQKAGRPPRYVIFGDDSGVVTGVALPRVPLPPALPGPPAQFANSIWSGYAVGKPRPVTAYVLEADGRSLCAIGAVRLRSAGQEVDFSELGPLLPVSAPQIAGGFSPDGYYHGLGGPGSPPVAGSVFGSFPDANRGSIRVGPFHLDRSTEIAIPVVTGPDNAFLSIVVRDAVSGQTLAQLNPPAIRTSWWAWRPGLPRDRELTIEIIADDKGAGWGQWIALGWPHVFVEQ